MDTFSIVLNKSQLVGNTTESKEFRCEGPVRSLYLSRSMTNYFQAQERQLDVIVLQGQHF